MTYLTPADRIRIAKAHGHFLKLPRRSAGNPRVLIFREQRIAYIPIPKAGCSSIKAAMLPLVGVEPSTIQENSRLHQFEGFEHIHYHRFQKIRTDDWFVFTVVRNPFRRYASAYLNKVVFEEVELADFRKMGLQKDDSFARFLELLLAWPPLALNEHAASQAVLLKKARKAGVTVFKLEELAESWPIIAEKIQVRCAMEIPALDQRNRGKAKIDWRSIYDPQTIALAKKLAAQECSQFEYDINQLG